MIIKATKPFKKSRKEHPVVFMDIDIEKHAEEEDSSEDEYVEFGDDEDRPAGAPLKRKKKKKKKKSRESDGKSLEERYQENMKEWEKEANKEKPKERVGGGRIIFELFTTIVPKTAENFRSLCTGEAGLGKKTGLPLKYEGSTFHRISPQFVLQAGDFEFNNGRGGESIYGGRFDDENFLLPHARKYLLSMANSGPNTNGSQFFVTLKKKLNFLNDKHTVFGRVIEGTHIIDEIEKIPQDPNNSPLGFTIRIAKAGQYQEEDQMNDSDSSDSSTSSSSSSYSSDNVEDKRPVKKKKYRHHEGELENIEEQQAEPTFSLTQYREAKANLLKQQRESGKRLYRGRGTMRYRTPPPPPSAS